MKYLKQFGIILAVSLAGELLSMLIPLPVPASIYGLVIMLICLCSGLVKLEQVGKTAHFLIEIMPLMFIPAGVELITSWKIISSNLAAYAIMTLMTTVAVMFVSGRVTQAVIRRRKKGGDGNGDV